MYCYEKSRLAQILIVLVFIFVLTMPAAAMENDQDFDIDSVNLVDCPIMINEDYPANTIFQIIDNTFHRWREYKIGSNGEIALFMEKPEKGPLTVEEARELLIASQRWMQEMRPLDLNEAEVVDPEDLPDHESLTPFIEEPLPGITEQTASDQPGAPIYRSDSLEINDSNRPSMKDSSAESETGKTPGNFFNVLNTDERVRVDYASVQKYPWNNIGFITVDFGQDLFRGTGFLISPHTVLTNAHNLYDSSHGGWFTDLLFYPGQYQQFEGGSLKRPFGSRSSYDAVIAEEYIDFEGDLHLSNPHDYGAFFIESAFEGISTFMPLEFNYELRPDHIINLAGYPGKVQGEDSLSMWHSFGPVIDVFDHELYYSATATSGNSGGPVWIFNSDTGIDRVVGLLAATGNGFSTGPRLANHNKEEIEIWMQWQPEEDLPEVNANTVGLYDASDGVFHLEDVEPFRYGPRNSDWLPLAGDWNDDGKTSTGLYDQSDGVFHLSGLEPFRFGPRNSDWLPVAGDWNGNGTENVGLYDPGDGVFHLQGEEPFRFGPRISQWLPVAGDWNGDGNFEVGLYDPSDGVFHLSGEQPFRFGPRNSDWLPLSGDWNGDNYEVGLYDPSDGVFHLEDQVPFRYGPRNSDWLSVSGKW